MQASASARILLDRLLSHTHLTDKEQDAILALGWSQARAGAHGDLVHRGAEVASCCVVMEGLIARTGHTADGGRQITAFYIPGDMPDLQSLMVQRAVTTLHAISNCRVLRVSRSDLRELFTHFPGIAQALWREIVSDANIAAEWIVNVGLRPAKQRLAHLLCEMAQRNLAEPQGSFEFAFPVTQTHLAEATGVSSVHVNRVVQELRREGLLDLKDHRVIVYDWEGLRQEAGFDPTYLGVMRRLARTP